MHSMNLKVIRNIGLLFLHTSPDDLLRRWRLQVMLMVYIYICMYVCTKFSFLFIC